MRSKHLLLMLLIALITPLAANAQQTLPYSYGFEDNDLSADGWTKTSGDIYSYAAHEGDYGFSFDWQISKDVYLVSPILTGGTDGIDVYFWYKAFEAEFLDHFYVGYTSNASAAPSTYTYGSLITSTTDWQQYVGTLPAGTVRMAIKYDVGNYVDGSILYLDDFSFEVPSTCPKPHNLTASLTPGNGTVATLTWERHPNGAEDAWVLEYGTDPDFAGATSVNVSTTPSNDLTGLTPETTYYARVKADCGSGDESDWCATISFIPTDSYSLTVCNGTEESMIIPIYGSYADEEQHNQMIYPASDLAAMNGMSITQMVFYLSWWWDGDGVGNWSISLGETAETELTGLDNTTQLTSVYSGPMTFNNDHTMMTITFTEPYIYTGGNLLVDFDNAADGDSNPTHFWGIEPGYNASYTDLFTDGLYDFLPKASFIYATPPSCPKPTNLIATLTPGYGSIATLSWTEKGTANDWILEYGTDPDFAGATSVNVSTTPSNDLTGLTPETTYYARVKADCGSGDESDWSNIINFTPTDAYTLTVCDGTATNQHIPFDGYNAYSDQHNQMIYPSSSLSGLNGMSITQLVFYLSDWDTDDEGDVGDWTISLGETTAATLNGLDGTTPLTQVYAGPMTFNSDHTTMTITFTDPYTYNGGNLLVDFDHLESSYNRAYFYGISTNDYASYNNYEEESYKFLPMVTFTYELPEACPKPTGLAVSNIMHTSADLFWSGTSDNYNVQYREAAYDTYSFFESFENANEFANWQFISNNTENTIEVSSEESRTGNYSVKFSSYDEATDYNQYLVTPELNVSGTLKFYYSSPEGLPETFKVGYSSTSDDVTNESAWIWGDEVIASRTVWQLFEMTIPEGTKYVAINYLSYYKYYLCVDDFGFVESTVPAGEWQTSTTSTGNTSLSSLTKGTTYDVQVQADCGGDQTSSWRATSFTTLSDDDKVFTTAGDWNEANNWTPSGVPTELQKVFIHANVTIPSGCVATAHRVTIEGSPEPIITIADGGQLAHNRDGVVVTMQKHINGYSATRDNYYLITVPDGFFDPHTVTGMTSGDYDLYSFDASKEGEEWQNFKAPGTFTEISYGNGYLYAHGTDVDLVFEDMMVYPCSENNYWYTLDFDEGTTPPAFNGWNLMGNPYTCNIYLRNEDPSSGINFYRINGTELVASNDAIAPMEAVFVKASGADQRIYFSRTAPASNTEGLLNMNLSNEDNKVDIARVRFGQGEGLEKFQLNPNHTKLYIPQNNKDYAVVYSEEKSGEMPVSFKAEKNGSYTLSFNTENVEFGYLHLIDNMTGADIDLLSGDCGSKSAMTAPSYTFEAKTTDYASRFKLVFSTGNGVNDESFAFISDGNIIVNAGPSTGSGTSILQVVDVMGRIMMQEENATRVSTSGMTPGVYVLRLINGDSVRTQKIVIK